MTARDFSAHIATHAWRGGRGGVHALASLKLLDPYIVMNALLILGETSKSKK